MNRITKDDVKQMGMVDLAHNHVFVKDHEAWYRDFEMEMPARDHIRAICARNSIECPVDNEEFDEYMFDLLQDGYETLEGMIAMYYNTLWGFAEVREVLKEYEDLEEQGKSIKLPCEVGDTVYGIILNELKEYKVFAINIGIRKHGNSCIVLANNHRNAVVDFELIDFGKTVFLTREKAENALKGAEDEAIKQGKAQ